MTASPFQAGYPSVEHLREAARRRTPRFAFEYLEGGCHSELNLARNTDELRKVRLQPYYLRDYPGAETEVELFGHTYAQPFGVSPIGLQGLMWPRATEILAGAAHRANLPFVLSTVATADIETVAELTEGRAWFQLYHPAKDELRDALLDRAAEAGLDVLVALADTPSFGYRPKEIRNGLSIPPKMSARNVWQMVTHPTWALGQLGAGAPRFATLTPYIPPGTSLAHLGLFMNQTFDGRLTKAKLRALRDRWKGKLVVKGIVSEEDAQAALQIGVDGLWVSNHGGRQHDRGPSAVASLRALVDRFGNQTTFMMDSGIRSGADVACALAAGADFTFLGRTFMYAVAALGATGGDHVIAMLERQLRQVMEQVGCPRPEALREHRID